MSNSINLILLLLAVVLSVNSFITKSTQQHNHRKKQRINLLQLEVDTAVVAVSAEVLIITGGVFISKTLIDGMALLQKNDETLARNVGTLARDVDNSLQALSKDLQQIKMDSDNTNNKLSTVVVSLGLFFAILGGSKTLVEAIEFLPSIPDKVKKSEEESEAQRSKEIIKDLRNQLKLNKMNDMSTIASNIG